MPLELDLRVPDAGSALSEFLVRRRARAEDVRDAVRAIIDAVIREGDRALCELTARLDGFSSDPAELMVPPAALAGACADIDPELRHALEFAAERIRAFHEGQRPRDRSHTDAAGVRLGERWTAIEAVGLYVPGGQASYPSSVLMNAIPARVAGVGRLVMVVPAPGGRVPAPVLAAAALAGVDAVYRIGGAQAIAALAYGTATIPTVDKIVGPGNAYVAEAKRQVYGQVGIDSIAGPSEILIVADGQNDSRAIAADLLAQAEHDRDAQAILVTDDAAFAQDVKAAVARQLGQLGRSAIAAASWDAHGAVILVEDLARDAPPLVDRLAPEHLELAVAEPDALLARIRHAGAIFLGRHTPEAVGDYVAGPSHVLPTGGGARFSGGLSVLDFMKRTTLIGCSAAALEAIGPAAIRLAEAEGLDGHARSVALRLDGAR
ncbi:MAG: histidinol dehydrogenase [Alphaproteobacteria bacterium]|nr:MAG: histidinol dehydrogenase [Alphaproteobacteria bacterium]